jgi:membrane-associated phospholipid phosphatase
MSTRDPSPPGERRSEARRGALRPLLDLLYAALRWIRGHVAGFYAALGVFLAAGLALSVAALLVFLGVAKLVGGGTTQSFDESILRWLHARPSPVLDALALAGTGLGSGAAMWVVLIGGTLYFWGSRHRYSLLLLWVALLGGRLLNRVLKAAYARPRPRMFGDEIHALGYTFEYPESASFPSGHATTAVVVFGTLAFLVARLEPTPRMRRLTFLAAALLVAVIGFARLYLGVHYPSDVIAGYLAGFVWAVFCALGIEAVRYFRDRKPEVAEEERDLEKGIRPLREALRGEG